MEEFRKLKLPESMLKAIEQDKFEKPTEIQEKAIPLVLEGRDVIAESATGSGKTLAFGAGIMKNCEKLGVIQALVLVPTRELANQDSKFLKHFAKFNPLEIAEVYGGVAMSPQIHQLEYADVVVGTPGRILDHISRRTISLSQVKILVLDEADRMLDMGFIEDVRQIMSKCTSQKQTLLFSATISREIMELSKDFMINPASVSAEPQVDPTKLKQYYYDVDDFQKFSLLVHLLKKEHAGLIMVFCNTQRNTDNVTKNLIANEIDAIAIHGGLSQDKRNRVMTMFHENKVCVLVCTDVASRGLDIKGVSHVYNYDIPNEATAYIHRIGRTARAGHEGIAISILASRDYDNFSNLRKRYELNIEKKELPEIPRVAFQYKSQSRFRGGGPRRFGGGGGFRAGGSRGRFSGGSRFGGRDGGDRRSSGGRGSGSRNFSSRGRANDHRSRGQRSMRGMRRTSYFAR